MKSPEEIKAKLKSLGQTFIRLEYDILTRNNLEKKWQERDKAIDETFEAIRQERSQAPERPNMFCQKHGYISCECPEEMGLSLKQLEAERKVIEAANNFKCNCYMGEITSSRMNLANALAALDSLGGGK